MKKLEDGQQARDTAVAALDRAREKGPWMSAVFFPNARGGVDCVVTTWEFQIGDFGKVMSALRNGLDARDPTSAAAEPLPSANFPIPERAFRKTGPRAADGDGAAPGPHLAVVGADEGDSHAVEDDPLPEAVLPVAEAAGDDQPE